MHIATVSTNTVRRVRAAQEKDFLKDRALYGTMYRDQQGAFGRGRAIWAKWCRCR